ncbi:hypothetical protein ROLI_038630 [Roseobacter fucihabitans]|uniref:DUF948 domain-containing protein n=1 Tax=Roseobacter fucihabitans TaxID=1537242 RepID=A0ABZ2BXQ8_9RHOB|nr:hypothetical protein [Roseobacter litoralis]MBC6967315.1 hypothetical protein [Roseobacter litoralis]
MDLIADILLIAGALGAGVYCFVLGRRLNRFNDLERGVGGAVAVLSAQVDDLTKTLASAQDTAAGSAKTLTNLTERAEDMSRKLELQMASLHDIPTQPRPEVVSERVSATTHQAASEPMFVRHRATETH